jgi:hypothetical protein
LALLSAAVLKHPAKHHPDSRGECGRTVADLTAQRCHLDRQRLGLDPQRLGLDRQRLGLDRQRLDLDP